MTDSAPARILRHLAAVAGFGCLSLVFTYPLVLHIKEGAIGAGAGDNMSALWNIWWARTAMRGPEPLLATPDLFAPIGTSLALHSYAPLVSIVVSSLLPFAEPVTLYNVALLSAVFLNLTCAYAAAWRLTGEHLASFFAGVAFGGSPFLLVRLQGHLNVISAWGLPLLLIAALAYERRPGLLRAFALAGALVILAYTDYYFAIFGVVLLLLHLALRRSSPLLRAEPITPARRRVVVASLALILIAAVIVVWIESTGGVDTTIAGIRLRMTDSFNPRVGIGFLLLIALYAWKKPSFSRSIPIDRPSSDVWNFLPIAAAASLVLVLPILIAAVQLWRAGDYESQVYFWRSAPPGIDVGSLIAGNPIGRLTGAWTAVLYQRLAIDPVESAAWIGLAPLALLLAVLRRTHLRRRANVYLWIGLVFLVWSLGPYLRVFGYNTAFMLPQTFLRFVPVLANARIPGRAFVVVALMAAIVGALVLASIESSKRTRFAFVAIAAVVLDFWPAPFVWTPLDRPALYETLKGLPPGVLLEVPMGVRDGFGERGKLDHMALFYQTTHGHPLVGGFVARVSSRIKNAYESDPIFRPLLDLSEGRAAEPGSASCRESLACQVRYVVIDEGAASPDLVRFVNEAFSITPVQRDGARALYTVNGLRACSCER
jgi:hypothetical protein